MFGKMIAAIAFCSLGWGASAPPGWSLAGSRPSDYDTGLDAQAMYGGLPSAYTKSNKPAVDGFGTLMQYVKADQYLGKRLRFSAFVKTDVVKDWAGLWMRVDGDKEKREMLAFDNMQSRPIKGTTAWQNYEVVLDVPAGATGIGFGILLSGTGTAWINGVRLEVVGANIPVTQTKVEYETTSSPVNLALEGSGVGAPRGWWVGNASAYTAGVDPEAMYNGLTAVYLKSRTTPVSGFGTLMQSIKADNYRAKRVRFRASVKTEAVTEWVGLWMRVDGPFEGGRPKNLAFDNMQNRAIKGTTLWQPYDVVLDVPVDAQGISFGMLLSGPGSAWISGLSFEAVGSDVPTTQLEMPQPKAGPVNLELKGTAAAPPKGWFVAGSRRTSYSAAVENEGGTALLKSKDPAIDGFGTLMQTFRAEQYRGKRVRLSGLLRSEGVQRWAGLWMRVDKGQDSVAFDNMGDRPIKGTTGWQHYAVVLDVAPDATAIALGYLLDGTGAVWLTDAKFEVVGADVPTTGRQLAPAPRNMGFEK